MRIIFNEIKHIFNWKTVLLLVLFTTAFYYMFILPYSIDFPNGTEQVDLHIIDEMQRNYGHLLDKKGFVDFVKKYDNEAKRAEAYLGARPAYKKAGIASYKAFSNADIENPKISKLFQQAYDGKQGALFYDVQERGTIINFYKESLKKDYLEENENIPQYRHTAAQKARIEAIKKANSYKNIFPGTWVFDNSYDPAYNFEFVLVILTVLFMLGPVYLRDRRNKVWSLQYSSKEGRGVFKKKAIASFITVFLLITAQLTLFYTVYALSYPERYFGDEIVSFYSDFIPWYDITFLQYIMISFATVYIIGLCTALVVILVSRLSPNYVTLIGVFIPIAYVLINVLKRYSTSIYASQSFTIAEYAILIVVAVALPIILWRREKKLDICN